MGEKTGERGRAPWCLELLRVVKYFGPERTMSMGKRTMSFWGKKIQKRETVEDGRKERSCGLACTDRRYPSADHQPLACELAQLKLLLPAPILINRESAWAGRWEQMAKGVQMLPS